MRNVNIELRAVSALVKYNWESKMTTVTQDQNGDLFLPIASRMISRISYKNRTFTLFSGSPLKTGTYIDNIRNSMYLAPTDLCFIEPTVLLVADRNNNQIKLLDLAANKVLTLPVCLACVKQPWSLLCTKSSL